VPCQGKPGARIELLDEYVLTGWIYQSYHSGQETTQVYSFAWNTAGNLNGDYLAVVSYAADGNTFNDQFVEKIHLGDTYVTGPVALDATVAHITDLVTVNPNTSTVVLVIQTAVNALPTNLASQDSVSLVLRLPAGEGERLAVPFF
jgi:hypothetical protein